MKAEIDWGDRKDGTQGMVGIRLYPETIDEQQRLISDGWDKKAMDFKRIPDGQSGKFHYLICHMDFGNMKSKPYYRESECVPMEEKATKVVQ